MLVDLHCHTTNSDGLCTPEQLVQMAVDKKLAKIAITDHDTIKGCAIAVDFAQTQNLPVTIINGVELTIDVGKDEELHILGLNIDITNKLLNDKLQQLSTDRKNRINKIVIKLNELGYDISMREILTTTSDKKTFGRAHVAASLVAKGYFTTVAQVFDKLLHIGGPAYISHLKPTLKEAIDLIKHSGGTSIIAHPGFIKNQELIKDAITLGVDGLEAYYPSHTPKQVKHYKNIAQTHNLKISGGSDFHAIHGRYPKNLGIYCICANMINL